MGILDSITNLSPEQTQGLLAFASSALQAGSSGRPVSFGGALGGGIQAFQQSMDAQRKKKIEEAQAAQIAKLTGLKIQDAESDVANQAAARARAEQLRQFYIKQGGGLPQEPSSAGLPAASMGGIVGLVNEGMTPAAAAASLAGKSSPTVGNSQIMQGATSANLPPLPNPSVNKPKSLYEQRIAQSQALRNAGFGPEADAAETAALKFMPQVDSWESVRMGGKIYKKPYFKDGSSGEYIPAEVAEKLMKVDTGGKTLLAGEMSGNTYQTFTNTVDPNTTANNAVTIRGQNLTNDRAREANKISGGMRSDAQQQKVRDENLTKQGQIASFDTMLDSLDRLDKSPGLPRSVGLYSKVPTIPGSDSANFQAELETFKSQAFLPQVAQLKGMGALSDAEGKKLSAAVGALDPSMSEKAFRESIKRITDTMNTARERVVNSSRESVQQGSAQPQPARKSVMRGQVIDGYRFKGGDPSQQSNWEKQ